MGVHGPPRALDIMRADRLVDGAVRFRGEDLREGPRAHRHLLGTSMGGMHSWLWAEMYPVFMDAVMPLASLPVDRQELGRFDAGDAVALERARLRQDSGLERADRLVVRLDRTVERLPEP